MNARKILIAAFAAAVLQAPSTLSAQSGWTLQQCMDYAAEHNIQLQKSRISQEDAVGLIVNGYAKEVLNKLPMEFAVEAQKLLSVSLEGSVG